MPHYSELNISVIPDKDATVASAWFDGRAFSASSRRRSEDRYNQEIGVDLAVSRLLAKIARHLARRANGGVKHADDIRRDHERRRSISIPYTLSTEGQYGAAMENLMEDVAEQRERTRSGDIAQLIRSLEDRHSGESARDCPACQAIFAAQAHNRRVRGRHARPVTPGRHARPPAHDGRRPKGVDVPFDWRAKLMELIEENEADVEQR